MSERGDTAYSPRLREEEHSAAADELHSSAAMTNSAPLRSADEIRIGAGGGIMI